MRVDISDPSMLNTSWIAWSLLLTAAIWLWLTHNLRAGLVTDSSAAPALVAARERDIECNRFPDQCPCTTEWGKGIK